MIKKLSIILVFAICLAGCAVDPIKMVPGAKVIKSSKVVKLNKMVGEIPGIVVEVPADEVFSKNLNLEDSLTKKDIMRVVNEPGAKKALDAQMAREVAMEIKESNYEFWTKVTLVNFLVILFGWIAWTILGWWKNRVPKFNPFAAPATNKKSPLVVTKKDSLHDIDQPEL
jgi:hypothetical protein|tara:strand:- start:94 stop:603 length:510 start_codon:yes stop_codon:yes gene_type:complete